MFGCKILQYLFGTGYRTLNFVLKRVCILSLDVVENDLNVEPQGGKKEQSANLTQTELKLRIT